MPPFSKDFFIPKEIPTRICDGCNMSVKALMTHIYPNMYCPDCWAK